MNSIIIVGRTTKEMELKTLSSGSKTVGFCVAVDRITKNGKVTDFIDCVAWGKTAELLAQYVKKGERIGVQGSLQTRSYQDRDGNNRKAYEILVDRVEFLSEGQARAEQAPAPVEAPAPVAMPEPQEEGGQLPFEI